MQFDPKSVPLSRYRMIAGAIEAEEDLATVSGALLDQVFPVNK